MRRYATKAQLRRMEETVGQRRAELALDKSGKGHLPDAAGFRSETDKAAAKIEALTPPEPEVVEREHKVSIDALRRREKQLQDFLSHDMPDTKTMREAPPGSLAADAVWQEKAKHWTVDKAGKPVKCGPGMQPAIQEWRDLRAITRRDQFEYDPDLGNPELLRPDRVGALKVDFTRLRFAPGEGLTAEQWEERIGPLPPAQREMAKAKPVDPGAWLKKYNTKPSIQDGEEAQ